MRKRCIYLVQYFPPEKSSGSDLVIDLLKGFVKNGWVVDLFTPTPTRGVTKEQRKKYLRKRNESKFGGRLRIHRMHLYREHQGFFSRAFRYVIFSIECFWKALTVPADFIFTGSGPPTQGVVVGLVKKISRKKKIVYNLQDIFPDSLVTAGICGEDSAMMKIGRKLENFTYRNADVIITITDDMKENVLSKGVHSNKVKVVQNWIDVGRIKPIPPEDNQLFDELGIERKKFNVVYAGNLGKVQGIDVILEAARMLKDNKDIGFIIFGNGSEEERIKRIVRNMANVSVFPLQPMERVSEVYSIGSVSIVPCRPGTGGSGMPSKTWTIMATGTPIVASFDLGGEMEKMIKLSNAGFIAPAGDAIALAESILHLSKDNELVQMMGQNARKYVEIHNSKEVAVQKYIDIIEETCQL